MRFKTPPDRLAGGEGLIAPAAPAAVAGGGSKKRIRGKQLDPNKVLLKSGGQEAASNCLRPDAADQAGETTSNQSSGAQACAKNSGSGGKALKVYFANPDKWGPTAEGFLSTHAGEVWGVAEHHLQAEQLSTVKRRLKQHRVYAEPAALTGKSQAGTHAGVMLLMRAPLLTMPLPGDV